MLAGADSIDDLDVLRHGGMRKVIGWGPGALDVWHVPARVHLRSCAPVIAAARLRRGNTVSGQGAARLIGDAVAAARAAGASGQVMVRPDSAYYRQDVIAAIVKAKAQFSVTARMNPAVTQAITAIDDSAWTTIKYPRAIWDEDENRWVSEAQVAQTWFTAFTSHPKARQVTCRLVVRRVARLNPATAVAGQGELFTRRRHQAFVTNSTLTVVDADATHRDHAIVEQVIAELKDGPLAHAPSGKFHAQARWATVRTHLVAVPARIASSARRLVLHLPTHWPWATAWQDLWDIATTT